VVARAARRAGIPVLFLCHQLVEPDSSAAEWRIARLGLGLGNAYVTMTMREHEIVAQAFPGRPIGDGFHPVYDQLPRSGMTRAAARAQFGIAEDARLLLFFGFVRRYKGLGYLLDALAQAPADVRLLIAGEFWEDEAAYRQQIDRLGLRERVLIESRYIPNEAIEPYFVAADGLVLPYLSGSQSGVGMLAVDYELPVIASAVGGLGETIIDGDNGLVVPPADSAALAVAIGRLFSDRRAEQLRAGMARMRIRRSWDALVDIIDTTVAAIGEPAEQRRSHAQ
ncbi:MAG TPA: glycosyltransferase, partial [Roseiflexaceae bacterium]|nr:glycosyltransferase [Roseiflexaceae bacterium]